MEEITKQINNHKEIINNLIKKLSNIEDQKEILNIQNKINKEQAVIINLYEVLNNIKHNDDNLKKKKV